MISHYSQGSFISSALYINQNDVYLLPKWK